MSQFTVTGYTRPPTEAPAAERPTAKARYFLKYWERMANDEQKREAIADAKANGLGEEYLPVSFAKRRHEYA